MSLQTGCRVTGLGLYLHKRDHCFHQTLMGAHNLGVLKTTGLPGKAKEAEKLLGLKEVEEAGHLNATQHPALGPSLEGAGWEEDGMLGNSTASMPSFPTVSLCCGHAPDTPDIGRGTGR